MHQNWKPGHTDQQLGQPASNEAIHPLAAFLVDTGTVAVGVALAMKDKVPTPLRWVGGAVAIAGVIRAFGTIADIGA